MAKTLEIPSNLHEQLVNAAYAHNADFGDIIKNYKDYCIVSKHYMGKHHNPIIVHVNELDNYAGHVKTTFAELFTDNEPDIALAFAYITYLRTYDKSKAASIL